MLHRYTQGGYNIVLDVNSGAIHLMDKLGYDMLGDLKAPLAQTCPLPVKKRYIKNYSASEIDETYAEIYALYKADELFSADDYEKYDKITALSPVKAMCLHIAHDCNMRCEYCFASTGDYQGGRKLMSAETGKKAIDYLLHHSQGRHNLEVDFFGGEPLMNFDAIVEIVKYARSKEAEFNKTFRFTTTTNGLLLTEDKFEFLNNEMSNVVLSLDGRAEVNDRVRKRVDGSGTASAIIPHFQSFIKARGDKPYYVRGTFTKYNLDFVNDVLYLADKLGFEQISVEPVVSDSSVPYAITEDDLPVIFKEYEKLAEIMIDREGKTNWFNFFHFMIDLQQGPCAIKRLRGCGCGNEYVAVTPDGDVYPCHQFVGCDGWKMGSVFDLSIDSDMKKQFANSTVYGKEDCKNCWAKFYCSGGCNANGMLYNGSILKPHKLSCETEKKRVECALYIKAATL